jgi:hypothetical protein
MHCHWQRWNNWTHRVQLSVSLSPPPSARASHRTVHSRRLPSPVRNGSPWEAHSPGRTLPGGALRCAWRTARIHGQGLRRLAVQQSTRPDGSRPHGCTMRSCAPSTPQRQLQPLPPRILPRSGRSRRMCAMKRAAKAAEGTQRSPWRAAGRLAHQAGRSFSPLQPASTLSRRPGGTLARAPILNEWQVPTSRRPSRKRSALHPTKRRARGRNSRLGEATHRPLPCCADIGLPGRPFRQSQQIGCPSGRMAPSRAPHTCRFSLIPALVERDEIQWARPAVARMSPHAISSFAAGRADSARTPSHVLREAAGVPRAPHACRGPCALLWLRRPRRCPPVRSLARSAQNLESAETLRGGRSKYEKYRRDEGAPLVPPDNSGHHVIP